MAELETHQVQHGTRPGDKYVRRVRPAEEGFRRVGPGHLEALPRTLEPTTGVGRVLRRAQARSSSAPRSARPPPRTSG